MSVTRNHGLVSFECDDCGDVLETSLEDFYTALAFAKRNGWEAIRVENEWKHRCPNCTEEEE